MPQATSNYANRPVKKKVPVGTVGGEEALMPLKGGIMHKLIGDGDGGWRLLCNQKKPGRYEYMGFPVAVTCARCKPLNPYAKKISDDSAA